MRVGPLSSWGARFAGRKELRRRLRPSSAAWFPLGHLPPWPSALATWRRLSSATPPRCLQGPLLCLPNTDLARHVLVTGLTGAHKTTALTLPVLLAAARAGVSVVAFDLKYGERDSLAGAVPEWWRRGRNVLVFAPLDGASLRWNPLAQCRSFGDAYEFAAHLFPDEANQDADFGYWTGAERHVCAALVWALASDDGGRSIARLRALAEAGPDAVSAYVRRHPHTSVIAGHLGAFGSMLPKDQAGILQGIAARLEAWTDTRVSMATAEPRGAHARDEIVLARLRHEPTLLLVGVPQAALARLRILCQLLMRVLSAQMLRPRGRDESVPVLYVLEELPAWGALPGLADHLATFRSREVAIVATVQSEAQGQSVYGTTGWAAIAANFVTKVYFSSLADLDAERLSRALGTTFADRVSRSRGWSGTGRQESEHTHVFEMPLRRPESLQGIGAMEDEILVRCARLPPARVWCPPFHVLPEYSRLVPEIAPATVEMAVRHHARCQERETGTQRASTEGLQPSSPASAAPLALHVAAPPTPVAVPPPAAQRRGDPTDDRAGDDLSGFVNTLLDDGGARAGLRVMCRGDRPVELRLQSELAFRLLGNGETAQAVVRRWAARRWVRHARPVLVLERRALEALSADLRRRLAALGESPDALPSFRGRRT